MRGLVGSLTKNAFLRKVRHDSFHGTGIVRGWVYDSRFAKLPAGVMEERDGLLLRKRRSLMAVRDRPGEKPTRKTNRNSNKHTYIHTYIHVSCTEYDLHLRSYIHVSFGRTCSISARTINTWLLRARPHTNLARSAAPVISVCPRRAPTKNKTAVYRGRRTGQKKTPLYSIYPAGTVPGQEPSAKSARNYCQQFYTYNNLEVGRHVSACCRSYRRVRGDDLRHLLGQGVRGRAVAAPGGERHSSHGERQGLAGEVCEDAVESVFDVRQCALRRTQRKKKGVRKHVQNTK